MLVHLSISNFAIIKRLDIELEPGLNILSGETGAGKSIIINAVNLILGGRAASDLIRTGCNEARVEAMFRFSPRSGVDDLLEALGLPRAGGEVLISRSLFKEGRNRVTVNGAMATLQMLNRLGESLISISGQHEHQRLLRPENHLHLLDDFGGLTPQRLQLAADYEQYREACDRIERLRETLRLEEEARELREFQAREIEAARPVPGEDEELEQEKRRLLHAEDLLNMVTAAYEELYEQGDSALSVVSRHAKQLEKGAALDSRLGEVRESLLELQAGLEDAALSLRELRPEIRADPARLESVEERLQVLNRLKRKYGPTLSDVLEFRDKLAESRDLLEGLREEMKGLEGRAATLLEDLMARAEALSEKRKEAAAGLCAAVERELAHLHMAGTRFLVQFQEEEKGEARAAALRPEGFDRVEFLLAPNVGEEPRALARIASGGELSRITLALKTILARTASVETVVFDEVDAGIGGAAAAVVGEKLQALSDYHQVLCITHLPQIACKGPNHYLVKKVVLEGRTEAGIERLDREGRVREIARLLGGKQITPSAVAHAQEMLD